MRKRNTAMINLDTSKEKIRKHWSFGLIESINNPENIVKESENIIVIKDKYPKARIHYLVLPKEDIKSIYNLNNSHVNLIKEFGQLYEYFKKEHKSSVLKAGFHAVPSMQRLHMHIISTDFISPCLKTKQHWNSFTTIFFIPYSEIIKMLDEDGCIKKITTEEHKNLMSTILQCNQCSYKPKNMPQLKEHLLSHDN